MDLASIYKEAGALLEGHFLLASGKHSPYYLQSAKVLESPAQAMRLAQALATKIREAGIEADTVCAPAIGGLIAGFALAQAMDLRSIFVEKENGTMVLRRGFGVKEGERVIICEDIITTGGSARKAADALRKLGAKPVAYAALANRGICKRYDNENGSAKVECKLETDIPLFALGDFYFETYEPEACPLCKAGAGEAIKPGSRG